MSQCRKSISVFLQQCAYFLVGLGQSVCRHQEIWTVVSFTLVLLCSVEC